jgi:hypothetical protein
MAAKALPPGSSISPAQGAKLLKSDVRARQYIVPKANSLVTTGKKITGTNQITNEIGRFQAPKIIASARDLVGESTDYESPLAALPASPTDKDYRTFGYNGPLQAGQYYNPKNDRDSFDIAVPTEAVALADIPTSSTNFKRPRTVAAGYDPNTGTLTVVFRDGTFWNYDEVPESVWIKFHDSLSKGPMLNHRSRTQGFEGDLLSYQNGPADMSALSPEAQEFLYRVARTSQIRYANKSTGAAIQNKRPRNQPKLGTSGTVKQNATVAGILAKGVNKNAGKNTATANKPRKPRRP